MDLIQASSLATLCYLLIFAFIWQPVYEPQYTTGHSVGIMGFSFEGLSIKMFLI